MKNGNIRLRYLNESDIDDYIRWTTIETEWNDWDAPWEKHDGIEFVERQRTALNIVPGVFGKLEIDTSTGQHIGWVSSYSIDGDSEKLAVGIDIPPIDARGKGNGFSALSLFMAYLSIRRDKSILYTQTWSGNIPMIHLAEKIGFQQIRRDRNSREVRGMRYDGLTFSILRDTFFELHGDYGQYKIFV